MRSKEDAHDYRYFPDPDLLPVAVTEEDLRRARAALPELPEARYERFVTQYGLNPADADVIVTERAVADYYEALVAAAGDPRLAANWLTGEVFASLNREG